MLNTSSNKKASFFRTLEDDQVECLLCPHHCKINNGKKGICRGRINQKGVLYSKNYGQVSSISIDPIEKKPLYHFYPGSSILSLGTFGCNFSCKFCQNWQISQQEPMLRKYSPEEVVKQAVNEDVIGIAYTYSEPSVWYEFIYETSRLAHQNNFKNVIVSNGFINPEPLEKLLPYLDAANIDLKSFNSDFYKEYCGGNIDPILENIKKINQNNIHLELTTLVITGLNDSAEELKKLFNWIKEINPDIPLHLSRYFPNYKLDRPTTSIETMIKAYQLAQDYLNFVYLGNVNLEEGNNTICPQCKKEVIIRQAYRTNNKLKDGKCSYCGYDFKQKVFYKNFNKF